jgi:hypothetical protein
MAQKLTYEQWCEKIKISITDEARQALKEYHNIDADSEVEQARRKEYEFYINGGFDNV